MKIKKSIWLVLFVFILNLYYAQDKCSSAIQLTENTGWRGVDSFDVSERWHFFNAASTDYYVKLYIKDFSSGLYSDIRVFEGNCGSLSDITPSFNINGDTVDFYLSGLTATNNYFISFGNSASPNYEVYNIKLQNLNTLLPALPGCSATGSCNIAPTSTICEYVCNGSFECRVNAIFPFGPGNIDLVSNWSTVAYDNSPDYFHNQGNADWVNPCNYFGYQDPYPNPNYFPNRAYVGIMCSDGGYKEYIQTKLNAPLVANKTYIISMYVSQAENPYFNVTNPNIWLFNSQVNYATTSSFTPTGSIAPTIDPTPSKVNWQKVSYCYKANGGEQFLVIGGISITNSVVNTTTCTSTPNTVYGLDPFSQLGYMYIDEVSLLEVNLNIPLSYSICNTNTIQIANTQSCVPNDVNLTYTWTPPTNLSNSSILNPIASNTITTAYNLAITPSFTAGGSCPIINNTITVFAAPITPPTLTATTLSACPNSTVGLGASIASYNYTWMPGNLTGSNVVVTFTGTTTYTAMYTNSVNCTKTATIQIQSLVPANFTMAATASIYTVCSNLAQTTSLTATSNTTGLTYTWQPVALTGSQVVVTPAVATVYTVNTILNTCLITRTVSVSTKTDCCTSTLTAYSATSIPTTTTINTPFVFNTNLEIPAGSVLSLQNAEFVFAPGVQITVKGGGQLNLESVHLYSCGTDLWQGIYLEDGSRINALAGGNYNLIEDAYNAINITNHATSTYTTYGLNGILHVEKTIFNKNFVAISINNYSRNFTPYPFRLQECVFTSRTLTFTPTSWPNGSMTSPGLRAVTNNTAGLQVPYLLNNFALANLKNPYNAQPSHKGIELVSVGSSTGTVQYAIQLGSTESFTHMNIFDNLGQGIEATNSSLFSVNNVFQNSQQYSYDPPGPAPAYTFGGNGIRNAVTGDFNSKVDLFSGSTNMSLGNRFYNTSFAVNCDKTFALNIRYCTFRSTQTSTNTSATTGSVGIISRTNRFNHVISNNSMANLNTCINIVLSPNTYSYNGNSGYGIYANQLQLQNNYIGSQTTTAAGITTQYVNQAIALSAPSGTAFTVASSAFAIQTNTINRVFRGIDVNGMSRNNYAANTLTNTIILVNDNVFNANQYAIRYTNGRAGSVIGNNLTGFNTTNTLVSLYYSGSAKTVSVACNVLNNSFRAFEFNSGCDSTNWKGNSMTTHNQGLALTGTAVISQQGSIGNAINNSWSTITNDTWVESGSNAANSKVYVKAGSPWQPLSNNGSAPLGLRYSASGNVNTTTGTFTCTGGGGGGGGGGNSAQMSSLISSATYFNTLTNYSEEAKYIRDEARFRLIAEGGNGTGLNSNDQVYYTNLKNSSHGKFMQVENKLLSGDLAGANALNAAITCTNAVEQNYKDYYSLFYKFQMNAFTSADDVLLTSLVNLCPSKDGAVVYQARALRRFVTGGIHHYTNDCSALFASREAATTNLSNGFIPNLWTVGIYPNPSNGNFSIVSKTEKENLQLTIYDVSGKQLLNSTCITENFVFLMETNLNSGVYFVTIKNAQNETVTKKLVVTK